MITPILTIVVVSSITILILIGVVLCLLKSPVRPPELDDCEEALKEVGKYEENKH